MMKIIYFNLLGEQVKSHVVKQQPERHLRALQTYLSATAVAAILAGGGVQGATFDSWSTVLNNAVAQPGSGSA